MKNKTQDINKIKIAIVVTSTSLIKSFLIPLLTELNQKYDVTVLLNKDRPESLKNIDSSIKFIHIPIKRKINYLADIRALIYLIVILRNNKFNLVHTISPKAGLLGMVAAKITLVPIRIHTFQGEVWANMVGLKKNFFRWIDKTIVLLATSITVVSKSEQQYLIDENIIQKDKTTVIANGSICGVDLKRFRPDKVMREHFREKLAINEHDILFMYIGRLNFDKGLRELGEAFQRLSREINSVKLLIVGPDEDDIQQRLFSEINSINRNITFLPYTDQPENIMCAADILILPSHREGFGIVIIEAAALQIPSIASNIYGITDAVVGNKTGILFEKGSVSGLYTEMELLATDHNLRKKMGYDAYQRVRKYFDQELVLSAFKDYYSSLLKRI